ncbi:hypothetical protein F2P81_015568 [Scophthalmus maximus]|uniref:Uncharacterized protein n=1 Tax=Scophthalmus maximus TaxID=52904 RepID=A0A6A4SMA0_SCOMX|nr:hypothetical protein F2P81_015568 [Scophthalmus maximus]
MPLPLECVTLISTRVAPIKETFGRCISGLQLERRLATAEKPQRELMIQSEIRVRMFLEQSGVEATAALCSVAQRHNCDLRMTLFRCARKMAIKFLNPELGRRHIDRLPS